MPSELTGELCSRGGMSLKGSWILACLPGIALTNQTNYPPNPDQPVCGSQAAQLPKLWFSNQCTVIHTSIRAHS